MIRLITQNNLLSKNLSEALKEFNVQTKENPAEKTEAVIFLGLQEEADAFFKNEPDFPVILIGATHPQAFYCFSTPFRLSDLKKKLEEISYHFKKAPSFENAFFTFSGRLRQLTDKKTGNIISLSEKENELIVYLVQNAGKIIPKNTLLTEVWNYHHETQTHTIETHLYNLRQKIGPRADCLIENSPEGYKLLL